jgi:hypothetical protein
MNTNNIKVYCLHDYKKNLKVPNAKKGSGKREFLGTTCIDLCGL